MAEVKKMQVRKLTDEEIEKVSGGSVVGIGYQQTIPGFSYGCMIYCPKCGNEDSNEFYCDGDILAAVQKDLYTCAKCGQQFCAATGYGITDII